MPRPILPATATALFALYRFSLSRTISERHMLLQKEKIILMLRGFSGGSKGGGGEGPPPQGVQILSISCSFWENLAKSSVGAAHPLGELAPPPRGNPGSATGIKGLMD